MIGFSPHSQRFLDFMKKSFTHVFVRPHIDLIIHLTGCVWDLRESLAMQEICMAGFRIRVQIGEVSKAIFFGAGITRCSLEDFVRQSWVTGRFILQSKAMIQHWWSLATHRFGCSFLDACILHYICMETLCSSDIAICLVRFAASFLLQFSAFVWRHFFRWQFAFGLDSSMTPIH